MRDPAQALEAARRAAVARSDDAAPTAPWSLEDEALSTRRLAEWAIIEPERGEIYSTRRFGRPITAIKLVLVRLLRQYIGEAFAQQSRFNAQVAAHVMRLEQRVAELEAERGRPAGVEPEPPSA